MERKSKIYLALIWISSAIPFGSTLQEVFIGGDLAMAFISVLTFTVIFPLSLLVTALIIFKEKKNSFLGATGPSEEGIENMLDQIGEGFQKMNEGDE